MEEDRWRPEPPPLLPGWRRQAQIAAGVFLLLWLFAWPYRDSLPDWARHPFMSDGEIRAEARGRIEGRISAAQTLIELMQATALRDRAQCEADRAAHVRNSDNCLGLEFMQAFDEEQIAKARADIAAAQRELNALPRE